jgi:2-oxoisovalerate dehydrogenase E1 component
MSRMKSNTAEEKMTLDEVREEILRDYELVHRSREASLLGRKEVLTGKAKFGIFGDGKELAQVCMAKQFRHGDWRSGYYRDMTFMFAIGELTVQQWFAQLYAHADLAHEPASAGRQMNGHFATRSLTEDGEWKDLTQQYNSSPDISPTAGQMPRLLGLAQASKVFRRNKDLHGHTHLSDLGNEVAFGTIGDASTSEGHFWETMNAAGVLQVPLAMSVWDDGWGISVSKDYQTTKGSISTLLQGFQKEEGTNGIRIYKARAWDYAGLNRVYEEAIALCREEHVPCLIHVEEVTQPQGHSTSGSHERYKSQDLLGLVQGVRLRGQVPPVDPQLPSGWRGHRQRGRSGQHREAGAHRRAHCTESRMGRVLCPHQGGTGRSGHADRCTGDRRQLRRSRTICATRWIPVARM